MPVIESQETVEVNAFRKMQNANKHNMEDDSLSVPIKVSFIEHSKKVSISGEKERLSHMQNENRTSGPSERPSEVRTVDERFWLHDMTYLYERSFNELEKLFR